MARQSEIQPKSGASNKTPAPTKPARVRASDLEGVFGSGGVNKGHDGSYGMNRYGGPSSVAPGTTVESPMASDLRTTAAQGADGGDVLATVQKFGTAAMRNPLPGDSVEDVRGTPATQVRDIAKGAPPDAFGMQSARARQPSSGRK